MFPVSEVMVISPPCFCPWELMVLVVMSVSAWRVTFPALPRLENDCIGWVALISPCWLVILMLPPSALWLLLLASEVIIPVVMLFLASMLISPAFPLLVLLADMVLLGAFISPVLMLMMPPSPVSVVSVNI